MGLGYRGTPNINYIENDRSIRIGLESSVRFGALLEATDGPINDITNIGSEDLLVSTFGEPTATNFNDWLQIARVFDYQASGLGGEGRIVRCVGDGTLNGALEVTATAVLPEADTTTQLIRNEEEAVMPTVVFNDATSDSSTAKIKFFNKYPTTNAISIAVANATDFPTAEIRDGVTFLENFDEVPTGTQIAVAVLDASGNILERFTLDLVEGTNDDLGQSTFIETINDRSTRILCYVNNSVVSNNIFSFESTPLLLGNVVAPTQSDYVEQLDLFENYTSVPLEYFLASNPLVVTAAITLAENRSDIFVWFSVQLSDVVNVDRATATSNVIDYASSLNRSTTFASYIANAGFVLNTYMNKRQYIGLAGDALGLRIIRDLTNRYKPNGGLNYGQLRNVIRLAFNPSDAQQINIHRANGISVINYPSVGLILFEVNTFTPLNSVLRQNVSRITMNLIVSSLRRSLIFDLFELNDATTRAAIQAKVSSFLGLIANSGGLIDFLVIADESINTPAIIDNNLLLVEIRLVLPRVIKQITIRATIAQTGTNLETLV